MKVLVADAIPERYLAAIRELGAAVDYRPQLKAEELAGAVGDAEVLVVRSTEVHADCMAAGHQLSLVIRAGAGVNTIDIAAANARGIYVTNCPGKNAVAVAELTMGLMLALDRRIADNVADLRAGRWNKGEYSKADGLFGKTIGVIGTGQIGREVILRAKAFGLDVVAWSRSLTIDGARALGVRRAESVAELVPQSDIITVHLALKPETRNLVDRRVIGLMKPGTLFINTARAEIADEAALLDAVEAGRIFVGTDVYANEPEAKGGPFASPFAAHPRVYGTHHIGASTEQAQNAVAAEVVRIIGTYLHQGTVLNWVNRQKRTAARWQLVVRHRDKPGVLANVLGDLKSSGINVQEVENVIFEGEQTACCTLRLNAQPDAATMKAIESRRDEIIQATLTKL